jgi:AraC family ethanolamine operon transcriptional activator
MPSDPVSAPPAEAPSRSCVRLPSFDPNAMRVALQGGAIEHLQLGRGVFNGILTHSASDSLRTDWGRYNLPVQAWGGLSRNMLTVGVLVGGEGAWRIQGSAGASGDMVVLAEGGELLINLPNHAEWLAMQVPRERLEAAGVPLGDLRGVSAWRMGALPGDSVGHLADVAPVLAPLEAASVGADVDVETAQEQLFTALLCEWERRRALREPAHRLQPSERLRVVRRAEDYIEAQPGALLRIDDLCSAACTSIATLERVFREVFGITPRRYLTLRRLAGVRNDLLNGDPAHSVTEVATRWGFFHLGRFALEYGQLYGERPSQTRSRGESPRAKDRRGSIVVP